MPDKTASARLPLVALPGRPSFQEIKSACVTWPSRIPVRGQILEIAAAEYGHHRRGGRSATFFRTTEQRTGQLPGLGQGDRIGPPKCLLPSPTLRIHITP